MISSLRVGASILCSDGRAIPILSMSRGFPYVVKDLNAGRIAWTDGRLLRRTASQIGFFYLPYERY